jgi:hypothetical protein
VKDLFERYRERLEVGAYALEIGRRQAGEQSVFRPGIVRWWTDGFGAFRHETPPDGKRLMSLWLGRTRAWRRQAQKSSCEQYDVLCLERRYQADPASS